MKKRIIYNIMYYYDKKIIRFIFVIYNTYMTIKI